MEETKRRRFIIRAVLEGEVDVREAPPVPLPVLKVFNGKGRSGTSIVDDPNRALSEMISVGDGERFSVYNPNVDDYIIACLFTTGASTVESPVPLLCPESILGTTSAQGYDAWTITVEELYAMSKSGGNRYHYSMPSSGYIRLFFKKDAAGTEPIPAIGGKVTINGTEYQLEEHPAEDFE